MEDKKVDVLFKWKFKQHMAMAKEHALMETAEYRHKTIIRETHTEFKNGKQGKTEIIYWTPSDINNYETLDKLLEAIDLAYRPIPYSEKEGD